MKYSESENINKNINNKLDSVDNDAESGRVKGSIKERLINFLYRKRWNIKLIKNNVFIRKETKVRLRKRYINKQVKKHVTIINDYRDLKKLGKKAIDVDLKTENFDFEKYDYYIIEPVMKKGIDEETLRKIVTHKKIVENSKKIITTITKNINKININLKYPKQHQENLSNTYLELKNNIGLLREAIAKLPRKIDTTDLDNIILSDSEQALTTARDIVNIYQNKLDEYYKDLLVIDAINKAEFRRNVSFHSKKTEDPTSKNKVSNKTNNKNKIIESKISNSPVRLNKINKNKIANKKIVIDKKAEALKVFNKMKIEKIKNVDSQLKTEINATKELVTKMNKEVSKVTKEITEVTKVTGYARMLKSCLKIATGILTLPFNGLNIFNITLGSALINKGLHGIRKGLETKSEIKVNYNYEDLTEKIRKTKDKTKLTEILIMDSLEQIHLLKTEVSYLDSDTLDTLMKLEKNLDDKLKEIKGINNKLTKQEEKNKIKIKKVEKGEY